MTMMSPVILAASLRGASLRNDIVDAAIYAVMFGANYLTLDRWPFIHPLRNERIRLRKA